MTCLELLGGNSTDRQLIECIATTNNKQSYERLQSVALVFAGFLVFVMQVSCSYRMQYNFDIGLMRQIRDFTFLLTSSIILFRLALMLFLCKAGFAMICAGCVRKKNIQNTLLKNLLDACCSSLAFFAVGYAFAFGTKLDEESTSKTFVGTSNFFLVGVENLSFWFFQYVFSATAGMLIYSFHASIPNASPRISN